MPTGTGGFPRIYNSQILPKSGITPHPPRRTKLNKIWWTAFRWHSRTNVLGIIIGYVWLAPNLGRGQQPMLILPTKNQGLLHGDPASFYQYVQRDFEGQVSQAWEGGQYGFVRNPRRFGSAIVFTRFHEGIDIRPLNRDAAGEPTDVIHAIAAGKVAYTNCVAGYSNYGRYVVVEHTFDNCSYYSLYAHLNIIMVKPGDHVAQNAPLAIMGHTGEGIDRERAHVHLELNLMLNGHFSEWQTKYFPKDVDRHGIYNGMNLAGLDIGRFYLELQKNPALTIAQFVQKGEAWYRVIVPRSPTMDLQERYPWLLQGSHSGQSWELTFDRTGLPLQIRAVEEQVTTPSLTWVHPSAYPQNLMTKGHIQSGGSIPALTLEGQRFIDLVCPSSPVK
jgi:murein DD-endopeptidase MepM/ murein hydrolase activator NlpD